MEKVSFGGQSRLFNKLTIESSLLQISKKGQNLHEHAKYTVFRTS